MITEKDQKPTAYLLMRTDLPSMGLGKSRAQAMHAGNHMTYQLMVKPALMGKTIDPLVREWHDEGKGFGTTIAIGAPNQVSHADLRTSVMLAQSIKLLSGFVIDETYPYVVDDEIFARLDPSKHTRPPQKLDKGWRCFATEATAAWFLGYKDDLQKVIGHYDLTPN